MAVDTALDFTEPEVERMLSNLDSFGPEEVAEIDRLVDELSVRRYNKGVYNDLLKFCKHMQPEYIVGPGMANPSLSLSCSPRGF